MVNKITKLGLVAALILSTLGYAGTQKISRNSLRLDAGTPVAIGSDHEYRGNILERSIDINCDPDTNYPPFFRMTVDDSFIAEGQFNIIGCYSLCGNVLNNRSLTEEMLRNNSFSNREVNKQIRLAGTVATQRGESLSNEEIKKRITSNQYMWIPDNKSDSANICYTVSLELF